MSAGAHRDTKIHTHTQATLKTQGNTCQEMIENQHFHSSTVSQYSNKVSCIEEKHRVRQPAVRYTQKNKQKKNKYKHIQTQVTCWHVRVYEERERIRVRQPAVRYTQKSKQTNMHTCVYVHVCVYEERQRISVTLVTTTAQGCASDLMNARAPCVRVLFR